MNENDKANRVHKRLLFITIFIICLFIIPVKITKAANNLPEDINYDEIQKVIDDVLGQGNEFNFYGYIQKIINGEEAFSFETIARQLLQSVKGELAANINTFGSLITISLLAALLLICQWPLEIIRQQIQASMLLICLCSDS